MLQVRRVLLWHHRWLSWRLRGQLLDALSPIGSERHLPISDSGCRVSWISRRTMITCLWTARMPLCAKSLRCYKVAKSSIEEQWLLIDTGTYPESAGCKDCTRSETIL